MINYRFQNPKKNNLKTNNSNGLLRSLLNIKKNRVVRSVNINDDEKYINPYKKYQKKKTAIKIIYAIGSFLFIVGWILSILILPYFKINIININGLDLSDEDTAKILIAGSLKNKYWTILDNSYFLTNKQKIFTIINDNYLAQSVTIEKVFPNTINIYLEKKKTAIIYVSANRISLLDDSGKSIKELNKITPFDLITTSTNITTSSIAINTTEITITTTTALYLSSNAYKNYHYFINTNGDFPILFDNRNELSIDLKQIIDPNTAKTIVNYNTLISQRGIGSVKYFVLQNTNSGIEIVTDRIQSIFVQPKFDVENQIKIISSIVADNKLIKTIDLRTPGKVYWK